MDNAYHMLDRRPPDTVLVITPYHAPSQRDQLVRINKQRMTMDQERKLGWQWLIIVSCLTLPAAFSQAPVDTVLISDGTIAPYHGIAQQVVRRRGIKSAFIWTYGKTSTGFFIGPHLLLTNAHNMHSVFGSKVVRLAAHSGRTGERIGPVSRLLGRKQVREATWIPEAYGWNDFGNDYAIVRFPPDQPVQYSVFELALAQGNIQVGDSIYLAGYPAETRSGEALYLSRGVITEINEHTFHYTNWSERGNSGSPVWIKKNGKYLIVGVHAGGTSTRRTAKKVDEELLRTVKDWQQTR